MKYFLILSMAAIASLKADMLMEVKPPDIIVGLTRQLSINCSFIRTDITNMVKLFSLVITRSNDTENLNFYYQASVDDLDGLNNVTGDVSGLIDNRHESYITLTWKSPRSALTGWYSCQANGENLNGQEVKISRTYKVKITNPTIEDLLDVLEHQSSILEHHSSLLELQFSKIENQSSQIDLQSYKIENQSSIIDLQSSKIENQSSKIDLQSIRIDNQSSIIDLQSSKIEKQSSKIDLQSFRIDNQSSIIDLQSSKIENQSSKIDLQSSKIETQSSIIDRQSSKIESQSSQIELQASQISKLQQDFGQIGPSVNEKCICCERFNKSVKSLYQISTVHNGSRYYLSPSSSILLMKEAEAQCELLGGYLIEMDSEGEYLFIKSFLQNTTGYATVYTGGNDEALENNWVNTYSKTSVKYIKWGPGQPNDGRTSNCVGLWKDRDWAAVDYQCLQGVSPANRGYLCEVPEL